MNFLKRTSVLCSSVLVIACSNNSGSTSQAITSDLDLPNRLPRHIGATLAPLYEKNADGSFTFKCTATLLPQEPGGVKTLGVTARHCINLTESNGKFWLRIDETGKEALGKKSAAEIEMLGVPPTVPVTIEGDYKTHDLVIFSMPKSKGLEQFQNDIEWSVDISDIPRVGYVGGFGLSAKGGKPPDGFQKNWFEAQVSSLVQSGGCQNEILVRSIHESTASVSAKGDSGGPMLTISGNKVRVAGMIAGGIADRGVDGLIGTNTITRVVPLGGIRRWASLIAKGTPADQITDIGTQPGDLPLKTEPSGKCEKVDHLFKFDQHKQVSIEQLSTLPKVAKAQNNALATGRLGEDCTFTAFSNDDGKNIIGLTSGHCFKTGKNIPCQIKMYEGSDRLVVRSCSFLKEGNGDIAYFSFEGFKPKYFVRKGAAGNKHYSVSTFGDDPVKAIEGKVEFSGVDENLVALKSTTVSRDGTMHTHKVSAVSSWSGAGVFNAETGNLVCVHSGESKFHNKCVVPE